MDEVGIGLLCPTPRHLIEIVRKDAHRYRNGDALRVEEAELVFPIETSRRDPRVRQPVVGDVVEDVVSGKALGLAVEDTCDQRQTSRVVVDHPGGKADGGIRNSVQRLRVGPHLECIGHVCRKEVLQLLVEACFLVIKIGRRRAAGLDRRCDDVRVCWPGVISRISAAPANAHKLSVVPELVESTSGLLIGDRNYHSPKTKEELSRVGVELLAPYSSKKRDPAPKKSALLSRFRYRIDTIFSQLTERYCVKKVWARDLWHLASRLVRKVLSHTVAFLLNHQMGNPPLQLSKLLVQ